MFRKMALLSTAFIAPACLSSAAMAQTVSSGLDEVIVTAQKRTENLQEVPVSVTTMPTETLTSILQGGEDIRALATRIPGLYAESSNGRVAPRFYIRGLGNTDFDLAASQPVSIIMDDVVQENVVLKSFPLFDVQNVEVLRGPQGTLFGRNTPAGLVKFDSVKPTQDMNGYGSVSYGTYGSIKAEGAIGGAIIKDVLSARVSALFTSRDDWIDNGFTNTQDQYGGFEDIAGRAQLLWTPNADVDVLLNVHARDLDGTSALFRANILGPGDNQLNSFFDRDVVFLDAGDGNKQSYKSQGGSIKVGWDFGRISMTSISAYETADGTSRGDIDGGSGAVFLPGGSFPGFIPFPSDTLDGIDDVNQFSQEIRFASETSGPLSWQAGFFYFDSDLTITTNPFFAPATTVRHDNQTWALFGRGEYQLSDQFTISAGLRYTDDSKDFTGVATNFPVTPISVSDNEISWDASLAYQVNDNVNLYARAARGFRAPSIQGRDVAFFGAPSVAESEIIQSYEFGWKTQFADNRIRWNASAFIYNADDLQFSAIGGGGNFNQLVNADGKAAGFETDFEFLPLDNLLLTAGFAYTDTEITEDNLRVVPCGGGCTVLDPVDANGTALIEGNPFPQAPDVTFNATARFSLPVGDDGEFYAFTDWALQGDTNFFLYEAAEFSSSGNIEGGLRVGYQFMDGQYDVAVFARNILDAENVKGGIDFNNLTGFVNEPRIIGVAGSANF